MAGLETELGVTTQGPDTLALGVNEESMVAVPHNSDSHYAQENKRDSQEPEAWDRDDSMVIMAQRQGGITGRIKAAILRAFNYLIRLRGSPEDVAWGLSIGLFIAMTPTVGLQMAIAIPVATALRGNPAAAAAGCWLTNPLTIPFLYGLNYWIGASILGYESTFAVQGELTLDMLLSSGSHVWWSLIVGGVITGLGSAALAYYPTIYAVRTGREALVRRRERRRARREARARAQAQAIIHAPSTILKAPTDPRH